MSYFKVDPSVVVFFPASPYSKMNSSGMLVIFNADVCGIYHGRVKVEVFYVDGSKLGSFAQDETAEKEFVEL
jgi:hypothetical protein